MEFQGSPPLPNSIFKGVGIAKNETGNDPRPRFRFSKNEKWSLTPREIIFKVAVSFQGIPWFPVQSQHPEGQSLSQQQVDWWRKTFGIEPTQLQPVWTQE